MKILSIKEENFKTDMYYGVYEGYRVKTDGDDILLGISSGQSCCENYGYFMTNDNVQDFVGATVFEVKTVDTSLNVKTLKDFYQPYLMFVNIETDRGTLQFTAYNEHNGYYGHEAVVAWGDFKESECL